MAIRPVPRSHRRLSDLASTVGLHGEVAGAFPSPGSQFIAPLGVYRVMPAAMQEGWLFACPLYVPTTMRFDQLGFRVETASGAGGVLRTGIYAADVNGKPGVLLVDAGTTAIATAGIKTRSMTPLTLSPGVYYTAAVEQGSAAPSAVLKGFHEDTSFNPLIGMKELGMNNVLAYADTGVGQNPLPATFLVPPGNAGFGPAIGMRRAA